MAAAGPAPAPRLADARRKRDALAADGELPQVALPGSPEHDRIVARLGPRPRTRAPEAGAPTKRVPVSDFATSAGASSPASARTPPSVPAGWSARAATAAKVYGATYAPGAFVVSPTYANEGYESVTVTNRSDFTWTTGQYFLSYHLYRSSDQALITYNGAFTTLPTMAPNTQVTVNAVVQRLPAGSFTLFWDLLDNSTAPSSWFSAHGVAQSGITFAIPHSAPSLTISSPAVNATVFTLTPALVVDIGSDNTQPVSVNFQVCPASGACVDSGWLPVSLNPDAFVTTKTWTVPAGLLSWNTTYSWKARVRDTSFTALPFSTPSPLTTVVPIPAGSSFGSDPASLDAAGVNMYLGNFTRSEHDLNVAGPWLPLSLDRTYNSADTKVGVLGTGWSSLLDMTWSETADKTVTVTFPDGKRASYGRNPDGKYVSGYGMATAPTLDEPARTLKMQSIGYAFSPSTGRLVSITSPDGDQLAFTYPTGSSQPSRMTDVRSGRSIYFEWTGSLLSGAAVVQVGTPGGLTWAYGYTGTLLTSVCDTRTAANPRCSSYGYGGTDATHTVPRLTSYTPPGAQNWQRVSYSGDHVSSVLYNDIAPNGTTPTGWRYSRTALPDPTRNAALVVEVTDPNGAKAWYQYGEFGDLTERWAGGSSMATSPHRNWAYDALGRVAGLVDENGNVTEFYWDSISGQISNVNKYRDANTIVSTYHQYYSTAPPSYDPRNGLVTAIDDAAGHRTTYTYGSLGKIKTRTTPSTAAASSGATTTYRWTCQDVSAPPVVNDPGAPAGATQPCALLAAVVDPDGHTTTYGYNRWGDRTQEVTPTGQTTDSGYDVFGRLTTQTVVTPQVPSGVTTTYGYTLLGKIATVQEPSVTNPTANVTHRRLITYSYDVDANLTGQTETDQATGGTADPTRTTTYEYDARGRRTRTLVNGAVQSVLGYDAMGDVVRSDDGNGTRYVFTYNSLSQLVKRGITGFVDDPAPGSSTTPRTVTTAQYTYDPGGRLASFTDAMNHTVRYTYSPDDLMLTETFAGFHDPNGQTRDLVLHSYGYDLAGNLTRDTAGSGASARTVTSSFDAANQRTSTTVDPGGLNRNTTFGYDAAGQLTSKVLTDGTRTETTTLVYNGGGQVIRSVVDNDSTPDLVTQYARDPQGHILAVTDPRAASPTVPDPAYTTTYTYDALGRLASATLPAVATDGGTGAAPVSRTATTRYGYDAFGDLTGVVDPLGRTTSLTYDALGRPTSVRYPQLQAGGGTSVTPTRSLGYDGNGNVVTAVDERGQTTAYGYDKRNRLITVTDPPAVAGAAAGVSHYVYDDVGNLLSELDQTGAQTLHVWDDLGRQRQLTRVERKHAGGPYTTTYGYDDFGDVTSVATANVLATRTYDKAGEVLTSTSTGLGTTRYGYDVAGRQVTVTDPVNRVRTASYDLAGRLTEQKLIGASGEPVAISSYTTDRAGNVTTVWDADVRPWQASYDGRNQITSLTDPAPATADGTVLPAPVTTFGYDDTGHLSRVTDANGNATYRTYNPLGLLATVVEPATAAHPAAADRTWTTGYDAAGAPTVQTEPGGVGVTSRYDNLGRMIGQTGSGGDRNASRSFGYDLAGRMTSAGSPDRSLEFVYDDRGLLTSGGAPDTTGDGYLYRYSATYDAEGRPSTTTDPGGAVSYTYSGLDQVATATDSLTGATRRYSYDPAGRLTLESDTVAALQQGAVRRYTYDEAGRLATDTQYSPTGTVTASVNYTWDPVGNLMTATSGGQLANPHTETYKYDADHRLIRTTTGSSGTDYRWDGVGNRTATTTWTGGSAHTVTGTVTASYDQRNRLTSTSGPSGSASYGWTPRGTSASVTTTPAGGTATTVQRRFDAFDRMISDGSATGTYGYDPLDRLDTVQGSAGVLAYSGLGGEPVHDGGSTAVARAADGSPLAVRAGSAAATSVLQNAHGDVVAGVNPSTGAVTDSRSYDPFGSVNGSTGSHPPIGFQGGWTTGSGSGLVNARARWYDPATGGFISRDTLQPPVDRASATNRYGYGGGNPTSYSDPSGHFLDSIGRGLVGFVDEIAHDAAAGARAAAAVAEEAAGAAGRAGLLRLLGSACIRACAYIPYVDVVFAVGLAAWALWEMTHAGGPSAGSQQLAPSPGSVTNPRTGAPRAEGCSTQPGAGPGAGGCAVRAPPPPPPAAAPVYVTGTETVTKVTGTRVTHSHWYDSTYIYERTDSYTYTTTYHWTYFSDGSWTEHWAPGPTRRDWTVVWRPIQDWTTTVNFGTLQAHGTQPPGSTQLLASPTGTCGATGDPDSCTPQPPEAPLPPGALTADTPDPEPRTAGGGSGAKPPAVPPVASCTPDPAEQPEGRSARDLLSARADGRRLYRGVKSTHENFDLAQRGIAEPLGGHSSPAVHNGGDTRSVFTSWSTDPRVALGAALPSGVVLRIPNADGPGYRRVVSPDDFDEAEVLVEGTVCGAEVFHWDLNR